MTLLLATMVPIVGLGCASSGNAAGSGGTSAGGSGGRLTKGVQMSKEQANEQTVTKATFGGGGSRQETPRPPTYFPSIVQMVVRLG
ncbi:MAG: hypothetical protein ABI818_07570 [Acidobacteriota bacterium]